MNVDQHITHGLGTQEHLQLTPVLTSAIDNLTRVDSQLYRFGLQRTVDEIRAMERATHSKVLCDERVDSLRTELREITGPIRGLWY